MSTITTVIFDMYETLAHNNSGLWLETFGEICGAQHLSIDAEKLWLRWKSLEMKFRQGRLNLEEPEKSPPFKSYQEAWMDCFDAVFRQLSLKGDASEAARMSVEAMGRRESYPDAMEALPALQARWKTGLLSNADNDYLLPTVKRLGIRFDAVLSSETAQAYKPHPAPFRQIMDSLGVGPEECVYVGDNQLDDVVGAHRVGMRMAWVNRNGSIPDPGLPQPDCQVKDLNELPAILERFERQDQDS